MTNARLLTLAASLAAAAACTLRAPRTTEPICNADAQCHSGQVCFANECRSPASALHAAVMEVTPPINSGYAPQQQALDLTTSAVATVDLALPQRLAAQVVQGADGGAAVPSALVAFEDARGTLAGRALRVTAQTDALGNFSVRLAEGPWRLRIMPPAPLPRYSTLLLALFEQNAVFRLPGPSDLARVAGSLKSAGAPLAGARVTAVDAEGEPLAATAIADSSGRFELLLPPPPVSYSLRIGDAPDGGASFAGGPIPSFIEEPSAPRTASTLATSIDVDVGPLPPAATLGGKVVGPDGGPVAGATVLAATENSAGWTISRSVTSGADGKFQLALREGKYRVGAAPPADPNAPALSSIQTLSVTQGASVVLDCPRKASAVGRVVRNGGRALGAGATVTAQRVADQLYGPRAGSASNTDPNGFFSLVGDPGTWRIEVIPTPESGEPRQIAYLELPPQAPGAPPAQLDDIRLSLPLVVVGQVRGPQDGRAVPVPGASVDVFAVSTNRDSAVHLGAAVTDSSGKYRLVLPDVSQPASTPKPP